MDVLPDCGEEAENGLDIGRAGGGGMGAGRGTLAVGFGVVVVVLVGAGGAGGGGVELLELKGGKEGGTGGGRKGTSELARQLCDNA